MIDYKNYAITFAREIQKLEHKNVDLDLDTIKYIRKFKTELGYFIPESLEEGSGSLIGKE